MLADIRPAILVLNAGATPPMAPSLRVPQESWLRGKKSTRNDGAIAFRLKSDPGVTALKGGSGGLAVRLGPLHMVFLLTVSRLAEALSVS
jgi:hypothetical protein